MVTVTGEEDEINIFQSNCKIFAFDSVSKCWKERGNGSLRLNDRIDTSPQDVDSRIIVRSMGIQKVILNTKVRLHVISKKGVVFFKKICSNPKTNWTILKEKLSIFIKKN